MDKPSKLVKNSTKNIKAKVKIKQKPSIIVSARTPRSGRLNIQTNKPFLEKMKSHPTITYRQIQNSIFQTQVHGSLSYIARSSKNNCQTQSNIVNYLSDRHTSESKNSDKRQKQKKKDKKHKKNFSVRRNTIVSVQSSPKKMQQILKKTKDVLTKYKKKEEEWRKQKSYLMSQIERYKRKINGKSITTNTSSHINNKLLI